MSGNDIQGATFCFKKVEAISETDNTTAETPQDENKLTPEVSGEQSPKRSTPQEAKQDDSSAKMFVINQTLGLVKKTYSTILSNVSGSSTLQAQLHTASNLLSSSISLAITTATNPALAVVQVAGMAINGISKEAQFQRDKSWNDYELEQYNANRGFSSTNRTRNG